MENFKSQREAYLSLLNTALRPLSMFGALSYKVDTNTGAEYVLLSDSIGNSHFMDVTGLDDEHVLLDIIAVSIGNTPASVIQDIVKRKLLNKLFREA